MYINAIFNRTDTLNLNFDNRTTELASTSSVLKNKIKSAPKYYNMRCNLRIGTTNYQTELHNTELTI